MILYHGTPRDIKAFDSQTIGSGAGGLLYGYGHYLSENQEIASGYSMSASKAQDAIAANKENFCLDGRQMSRTQIVQALESENEANLAVADYFMDALSHPFFKMPRRFEGRPKQQIWESLHSRITLAGPVQGSQARGHIYTVTFPAEAASKLLQWDEQMKDQPTLARLMGFGRPQSCIAIPFEGAWAVANPVSGDIISKNWANEDTARRHAENCMTDSRLNLRGSDIWKAYAKLFDAKDAASHLAAFGISGVRYRESSKPSDGFNVVVFPDREHLLRITHRDGAALTASDIEQENDAFAPAM